MIHKVFLDIDGVLNNFILEALARYGFPIAYEDYRPDWGWDMLKGIEAKYGVKVSPAEFWGSVDRSWWSESEVSAECFAIIDRCRRLVGDKNVCILTSPTRDPDCVAGKLEWIQQKLPPFLHRQFLIGPCKHFCARQDHLLVDDADHNVRDFRRNGGQAILVPRPWNTNYDLAHETMLYVHTRFDQLEERQHG